MIPHRRAAVVRQRQRLAQRHRTAVRQDRGHGALLVLANALTAVEGRDGHDHLVARLPNARRQCVAEDERRGAWLRQPPQHARAPRPVSRSVPPLRTSMTPPAISPERAYHSPAGRRHCKVRALNCCRKRVNWYMCVVDKKWLVSS